MAILRGTAEGVVAMHGANMAHLDIKPENVMIAHSQDGLPWQNKPLQSTDVRLGDCGMSLRMGPDEVVTHRWAAPLELQVSSSQTYFAQRRSASTEQSAKAKDSL